MIRDEQQYQMLELIGKIWFACPEFRFGQLLANLTREQDTGKLRDPFYVTDEELTRIMRSVIQESKLGL